MALGHHAWRPLKQKITGKKHGNVKHAVHVGPKSTLVHGVRADIRRQVSPCPVPAGSVCRAAWVFLCSAPVCESAVNIDLGLQINFSDRQIFRYGLREKGLYAPYQSDFIFTFTLLEFYDSSVHGPNVSLTICTKLTSVSKLNICIFPIDISCL